MQFIRKIILGENMMELPEKVDSLESCVSDLQQEVSRNTQRIDRLDGRFGEMRGPVMEQRVRRTLHNIAYYMGLDYRRPLQPMRIGRFTSEAVEAGLANDIKSGDLISFRKADNFFIAYDGEQMVYVAVEVSITIHNDDIERARRNAEYLRRFTGTRTLPAVAGAYVHHNVKDRLISPMEMIPDGERLPDSHLLPEEKTFFWEMDLPIST